MHHTNLLVGSRSWGYSIIPEAERTPGPDVTIYDQESLSIAHVRALALEAILRPVHREHRTFIIACDTLLHEAQNALLKLFEEPNAETAFYLIIPREDMLLPTLRSRLHVLAVEEENRDTGVFESFRKAPYSERLTLIQEKLAAEDSMWVESVVHGFEVYAEMKRDTRLMHEAMRTQSYIHTNGSSKKMLLEHLALTL